jgi:uncharacterized phage-like protein YoqJ
MIISVTGHRPPKVGGYVVPNPIYNAVMTALDEALIRLNPERVITGMALGVDQWVADLCIRNDIPFTAAIPFDGYDERWPWPSKALYRQLLRRAATIHVVSPGARYDPTLMQTRNVWMLQHSDTVLAVYNQSSGGTANCLRAARSMGKRIELANISPEIWEQARQIEAGMGSFEQRQLNIQAFNEPIPGPAEAEEFQRTWQRRERQQRNSLDAESRARIEAEGRASRERARARREEEQALREARRVSRVSRVVGNLSLEERQQLREVLDAEGVEIPQSMRGEMERIRTQVDLSIRAEAAQIPAELLDKDRAKNSVVAKARKEADEAADRERMKPKRVIEVGDD